MDFAPTPEQRALRDQVVRFARDNLGAQVAEHDRNATFDEIGWKACADFGVLGWPIKKEYGGGGLDPLTAIMAYEALGEGCVDNGLVFAINNHLFACAVYIADHGTEEQRHRWLPALCDGSLVGAHALSEPETGSDMLSLTTTAVRDGDGYVLNGTKKFISNGPRADLFIVFARTGGDDVAPQRALSAFVVPADTAGLTARDIPKAGLRGTLMGEITFDGCVVGEDQRLGAEGAGYQLFTSTMEWERGFMFASQVGVMSRLTDQCAKYAAGRRQFGRPIGAFQSVSHKIADMRVRLELARLMLYKVGWLRSEGRLAMQEASMLKLYVSEGLKATALDAMQIHGARGYTEELGIEREVRDVLAGTIYGGTSDIQRSIIAGLMGLPTTA
ncbi:L-prolyl-[peptidyl carrier protein] dehydrogenase [Streptomyces sp. cf386]|uniref:acyl-CoA dehydrogenase family protein n=1 Tax=Streptomyces sp. cf386 TaxID=1761904 RepID=UPI00087E3FAA|nr:acyl-CoA dehydrogenase family protein [Streptomyces sp. cf386]SDN75836.1 L-prolyl-[peptidyl carrier protein] dehydrogenase [Streptomyces sp. cf386]